MAAHPTKGGWLVTTEVLLLAGVVVAVALWVAVALTEGSLRPGYDATHHTANWIALLGVHRVAARQQA